MNLLTADDLIALVDFLASGLLVGCFCAGWIAGSIR